MSRRRGRTITRWSRTPTRACPSRERRSRTRTASTLLLGVAEPLKSRLERIARPIVEGIPAEDWTARARALESYLRDSGRFGYTLRMDVIDPSIDPVEDFLVNRKEGHCEYFASALTLMLRSIGIPARMVNGFKGGDWNALARIMSVRELHAHSWVEVLVGGDPRRGPEWITLDPTPAQERAESVARVGGLASRFRQGTDFIRYVWTFYVVGFNAERQKKLIYDPIRTLVQEARRGFAEMGQALSSAAAAGPRFPEFRLADQRPRLPRDLHRLVPGGRPRSRPGLARSPRHAVRPRGSPGRSEPDGGRGSSIGG